MNDSERQHEAADDSERQPATDDEQQTTAAGDPGATSRERQTHRRWPRWLGMVLLGLVILASGIVIGSVGTLVTIKRGMMRAVQQPEQIPERTARRLAARYDLTDEQQAQVQAILRERRQRLAQIRRRLRPHIDAELDRLREDMAEVLTDEQQAQWREDFDRLREAIQPPLYTPNESTEEPEAGAGALPASPPPETDTPRSG